MSRRGRSLRRFLAETNSFGDENYALLEDEKDGFGGKRPQERRCVPARRDGRRKACHKWYQTKDVCGNRIRDYLKERRARWVATSGGLAVRTMAAKQIGLQTFTAENDCVEVILLLR